jgi:diphthamide biosynthesis methyltransferase
MGQHTLALLDLDPTGAGTGEQKPMAPADAVISMKLMIEKAEENIDEMSGDDNLVRLKRQSLEDIIALENCDLPVVLCSDMGTKQQKMIYTNLAELSGLQGGRMNCLVFPASTSDVEEKALLRWLKEG